MSKEMSAEPELSENIYQPEWVHGVIAIFFNSIANCITCGFSYVYKAIDEAMSQDNPQQQTQRRNRNTAVIVIILSCLIILILVFHAMSRRKQERSDKMMKPLIDVHNENSPVKNLPYRWSVFDLAKTAFEPGHTEAAVKIIETLHYDVNSEIPSSGLTLFLCACLSGHKELIRYMLAKGADVRRTTKAGDTALYLATFGVLSSTHPDISILEDLIQAGCDVNMPNLNGYTALHRAAGHGNISVIQKLLKHGADPYQASANGIYPIDSAINAGNLDAAELVKINLANPHVWDVVEPHTPPHIQLGLQSPQRKHLMESTRRVMSPRIMH